MIQTTGAANHLEYGNITELNNAAAFTVMFWILLPTFISLGGICGNPNSAGFRLLNYLSTGNITCQVGGGPYGEFPGFTAGALVHAAVVFDGAGAANADRLKMYANGVAQTATSFSGTIPATIGASGVFHIGDETTNAVDLTSQIGQWRLWSIPLSAADVAREVYAYEPQRTDGLVLWGPFDDGLLFGNYSGSTYAATQIGTVAVSTTQTGTAGVQWPDRVRSPHRQARRGSRVSRRTADRRLGPLVPLFIAD